MTNRIYRHLSLVSDLLTHYYVKDSLPVQRAEHSISTKEGFLAKSGQSICKSSLSHNMCDAHKRKLDKRRPQNVSIVR